eukprot:3140527-Rhodomonas_salina.1
MQSSVSQSPALLAIPLPSLMLAVAWRTAVLAIPPSPLMWAEAAGAFSGTLQAVVGLALMLTDCAWRCTVLAGSSQPPVHTKSAALALVAIELPSLVPTVPRNSAGLQLPVHFSQSCVESHIPIAWIEKSWIKPQLVFDLSRTFPHSLLVK